jgi:hypothetical protein
MKRDQFTVDLFEVPQPAAPIAATMNYSAEVSHLVSDMLAGSGLDRYQVAAEVSRLTGREFSKAMLDGYTSEARDTFNLPLYKVPALETACRSHQLTSWLADKRGARILIGRETLAAELGKLENMRSQLGERIKQVRRVLGQES